MSGLKNMECSMSQLAEARIADLVRRKLTSGNSVPVERCTIFAKEIAKIDEEVAAIEAADEYAFAGPPATVEDVLTVLDEVAEKDALAAAAEAELDAYVVRRRREVQATIP